ncbi:MAG TPA: hypothetical protein PKY70_15730 [Nakamurella multipartita]|nr:hypothetical protein [Nakamurella multipartita]
MPIGWVAVLTVLLFLLVLTGLWAIGRRSRGRAAGGAVTGPFEEIWHPAAHRARIEVQIQDERIAPDLLPGDPPSASG